MHQLTKIILIILLNMILENILIPYNLVKKKFPKSFKNYSAFTYENKL